MGQNVFDKKGINSVEGKGSKNVKIYVIFLTKLADQAKQNFHLRTSKSAEREFSPS